MNTMSVTKYYSDHGTVSKIIPINDYPVYIAQGYKRTPMRTMSVPTVMPNEFDLGDATANYFGGLMAANNNLIKFGGMYA